MAPFGVVRGIPASRLQMNSDELPFIIADRTFEDAKGVQKFTSLD